MNNKDIEVTALKAVDVVKRNPEIYWANQNPSQEDTNLAMADQIKVESGHDCSIDKFDLWNIVVSAENWLKPLVSGENDIARLFEDVHGFDDGRKNSLRTEYFLNTVSSSVSVWYEGGLIPIKGAIDDSLAI